MDTEELTYRLLKAATVIDAGKVVNPMGARGVVMGGMCMGLSRASRECFAYSDGGQPISTQFRMYKTLRVGEQPEYLAEFIETPWEESPYGARGFGEHGIIGMAAALANALTTAVGVDLNQLPLTPEAIWKAKGGAAG